MHNLEFLEYSDFWKVYSEDEVLIGYLEKRQGNWAFIPETQVPWLTEAELLAIMVKLSQLNQNKLVIVVGN